MVQQTCTTLGFHCLDCHQSSGELLPHLFNLTQHPLYLTIVSHLLIISYKGCWAVYFLLHCPSGYPGSHFVIALTRVLGLSSPSYDGAIV